MSVPFVVLLRFLVPMLLMLWVAIVCGFPKFPGKESLYPMLIRCICFFLTQYCILWYLMHGSYVIAAVLSCTTPIFVPIADSLLYRMEMSLKMWISVFISFLGILLILRPDTSGWNMWAFLGLLSGIFGALGHVSFNQVAKREKPQDTCFYLFLFGSILSLMVECALWDNNQWVIFSDWIQKPSRIADLLLFGVVAVLAQLFRSRSYSYVKKTGSVTPLLYFTILFSALLSWLLFGEVLSPLSWIGIILVIGGGFVLLHRKKQDTG
jgi:drug/metabolite transporter (DMT)-like permease